jgi:hypothetical protein
LRNGYAVAVGQRDWVFQSGGSQALIGIHRVEKIVFRQDTRGETV